MTPVECGRSLETARRSELAEVAGYGYSRSHSRWFWGMRLHLACAPDGTPRAAALVAADRPEREVALTLLPRALKGGETIVCDKGYAGREFAHAVARLGATVLRPPRRNEPHTKTHLAPIRQRIESVFFTCKDLLSLERHGARTPRNLFARIATRPLALAACISLNHQLGRPSRAIRQLHSLTAWHQPSRAADVLERRSTRSPRRSASSAAARETCVPSYAPACFSACAGTPQTIRSGRVVR